MMDTLDPRGDAGDVVLVVDLDGTLILTDLLHESALKLLREAPLAALRIPSWLASGRAMLKHQIACRVDLDVRGLPYHEPFLAWLHTQRESGRRLVLCTASNTRYAQTVADHMGFFEDVIASDDVVNVSASRKAQILVGRYGEKGFDYAGNSAADLQVWPHARRAIVVNASARVATRARQQAEVAAEWPPQPARLRDWLRAIRLHQWLKNLLVLLPLAAAFRLGEWALLQQALLAMLAFGLCASSVYLLNDLIDLESDRAHPRKRLRPLASGRLSAPAGLWAALALLVGAAVLGSTARPAFQACLAGYFVLTLAYTFYLKRRVIVDCIALGSLYTIRVVAGWSAVGLPASFWLLAFSLFLFLSLAFLKRYSELHALTQSGRTDAPGRAYLASDLPVVQTMGVAAGFASVMLMALYINGDTVLSHYSRPEILWLTVPIQLYWVSHMWMQAHRGNMHDDPVVFAVRNRHSLACGAMFALTMALAR